VTLSADDVRAYLLEHPEFMDDNWSVLQALVPEEAGAGDESVQDFQRYRLAKLQDDYIALKAENEDLMDLMQEQLQRQNRINEAIAALLDTPDFFSTIHLIAREFPAMLDQEAVGFFLEAGGWLDQGDYDGLRVVAPGLVGRWLNGREAVLEEVDSALPDLFGEKARDVRSQALIRINIRDGLPPGLLALGHRDPMHYATGLATEQVEFLGGVIERCLRKWLT
jgi:uncharacterized protein YigA (DUF484 family)